MRKATVAASVGLAAAGNVTEANSCGSIPVDERVDCVKMNQGDCEGAGCCWIPVDPNPGNAPWCSFSDKKVQTCNMAGKPKVPFSDDEMGQVMQYFKANLNIQGSGMVVAAPDHNTGPGGDYYYDWMRDGALSMNALQLTAGQFSDVESFMDSWLSWIEKAVNAQDPNDQSVLTEPKFVIPDGTVFTGSWCRPQNDGPGLRAITLMQLAANKPSVAGRAWALVQKHLDWVATGWESNGCDLWEEVRSTDFFWNRLTMRKALLQGSKFAAAQGDSGRASNYKSVADTISSQLQSHVQSDGFVCEESSIRCKDTASIEAFNVGYMDDDVFPPLSKEAAATLAGLSKTFCKDFKINQDAASAGTPGVLFGRYEGDNYDGGNPWVLLTASASTLLYRQAEALAKGVKPDADTTAILSPLVGGSVTSDALIGAGDANLLLMKKYLSNGMHMNEQIARDDGHLTSAKDLTWNYANVLKAMAARKAATSATAQSSIINV